MSNNLKSSMQRDASNAIRTSENIINSPENDSHNAVYKSRLRRNRKLNPLRNFNSEASKAATQEYSKTTRRTGKVDALGAKYGHRAWDDAYAYADDKGNKAVVLCDDMNKEPYEIRLQVPNGTTTDIYVINSVSLLNHESNISSDEVTNIIESLAGQLESGASIEEIMQNFQKYQRSPYPPEIAKKVQNQQEINNEIADCVENLHKSNRYGMCIGEGLSTEFDPYMQCWYPPAGGFHLTQDNRGASGDMNTEVTESFVADVHYLNDTRDVSEIRLNAMRDYVMGKGYTSEYQEKLDIETLMKMGYDKENAQRKLNLVANNLLNGKPIKEVFLDNRQFMTEESNKKLHEDMLAKTPNMTHLSRSERGGM